VLNFIAERAPGASIARAAGMAGRQPPVNTPDVGANDLHRPRGLPRWA